MSKLTWLDLTNNKLNSLPERTFQDLVDLQELYLSSNPLTMTTRSSFSSLPSNLRLYVDAHEICECFISPHSMTCINRGPRNPYLTCERLLADKTWQSLHGLLVSML